MLRTAMRVKTISAITLFEVTGIKHFQMFDPNNSNPAYDKLEQEHRMRVLHLENSKSKKRHTFVKNGGLPPLLVWVPLLKVNNYSEFQVNIFSNNRDILENGSFRTTPTTTTTPPGL